MRPDVKLGVVISSVFVLVAGAYYIYRDQSDRTIPVSGSPGLIGQTLASKPAASSPTGKSSGTKRVARKPARRSGAAKGSKLAQRKNPTGNPARRSAKPGVVPGSGKRSKQAKNAVVSKPRAGVPLKRPTQRHAGAKAPVQRQLNKDALASRSRTGKKKSIAGNKNAHDVQLAGRSPRPIASRRNAVPSNATARKPVPLAASNTMGAVTNTTKKLSVPRVAVDTHRVQPGDTLSALAQRYYGSVALTAFLVKSNPQLANPDALKVGEAVRIPSRPVPSKSVSRSATKGQPKNVAARPAAAGKTYRVQPGDSFYKIAQEVLGDAGRWKELFELNKALVEGNPTRLRPGQELALPIS